MRKILALATAAIPALLLTSPSHAAPRGDDGEVGVDELLVVLGAWGTPHGDFTGDGTTDVNDILALVGYWGEDEQSLQLGFGIFTPIDGPPEVVDQYDDWGVQQSFTMNQFFLDEHEDGFWDGPERTLEFLNAFVPPDYSGYLCLNWEHGALGVLGDGPANSLFSSVIQQMSMAVEFVRSQRPLAKVGYYGLPLREYWHQDEEWYEPMYHCLPLLRRCNALFPSVYDLYGTQPDRDHERYAEIVRFAIELAEGSPVIPFTWHRHHNSTVNYGFTVIDDVEYVNHVENVLRVEHEGTAVHGIILWGGDLWFFNESQLVNDDGTYVHTGDKWDRVRAAFEQEMEPGQTIEAYLMILYPHVVANALDAVDRAQGAP